MCRSLLAQCSNGLLYSSSSVRKLEYRALQPLLRRGLAKRFIQPKKETQDPVAQRLYERLYKPTRKRTGDRSRVHVLSSGLCGKCESPSYNASADKISRRCYWATCTVFRKTQRLRYHRYIPRPLCLVRQTTRTSQTSDAFTPWAWGQDLWRIL